MSTAKTEVSIKINDRKLPLEVQQVLSLAVSKEVNKIPTAKLIIRDGAVEQQDFPISNTNYFAPGSRIEIWLGTPQRKELVFKGMVTKHGLKVSKNRSSVLIVECKDEAVRLTIGRKSRFFTEISDGDIFREIIQEYPRLRAEVKDAEAPVVHDQIVQYYTSDWDFMALRSEALGQYLFVDDGVVTVGPPQLSAEPAFALTYGVPADTRERSRIWEFESEMDARHQFAAVAASSWDYDQQNLVEGLGPATAEDADYSGNEGLSEVIGLETYRLHHQGRLLEPELTALAGAIQQKSKLNRSVGRVKFDGRADLRTGDLVRLEGVGDRFNGKVFVSRVHHQFTPGRWFTEIQFGLPYCWFHERREVTIPPALGLVPRIAGLQVGKVVSLKDEDDGAHAHRIKVSIPGYHRDEEGIWARVTTLTASGDQKGILFLPNVGDEVLLGYIDQDAREPVVLGALFSESTPPLFDNDDNNYRKGFITNSNHKVIIDDETNVIQLETAGGNKVVLDDDKGRLTLSKGQSTIELSGSEISIRSLSLKLDAQTIDILGKTTTNINSPTGGFVKLGNGIKPASGVGDPAALVTILPGPNVRVLI